MRSNNSFQPTVDPPVTFAAANVPVASTAAEFWRWAARKVLLLGFTVGLLVLGAGNVAAASGGSVITREQLNQMFSDMRTNSEYKNWNVDGELLWGYFFTDPDARKLQPVADYLTKNGYRFVDIYPTDDKTTFFLHVEKIEHHTPESLDQHNQEFNRLADRFQIQSYDGMDVGPVE